jgi:hypothetical protein
MVILAKPGAGPHEIALFNYNSSAPEPGRTFQMNANSTLLRRAAVDNRRRTVFLVEANTDTNLYAIPLDPAAATSKVPLRHSGQAVYYDPASETAFAPFNQGDGYTFSPIKVTSSGTTVQLKERVAPPDGDWAPPKDLRPVLLGIKNPPTFACP